MPSLKPMYPGSKKLGYDLTLEPDVDIFGFLGINFQKNGPNIELTQVGLTKKVIQYLQMEGATSRLTMKTNRTLCL